MKDLILVRFTNSEFDQVIKMKVGDVFSHINLLHKGTMMREDSSRIQSGIRIVKGGSIKDGIVVEPELDFENLIQLELLSIKSGFDVGGNYEINNLMLHDGKGILESLYARYNPVFGLTMNDILKMKFYVREFRIIKQSQATY